MLEMSGSPGTIEVGIKDSFQADDGSETKVPVQTTNEWQTFTIPLSRFTGADLKRVYVLVEFVFGGPSAQTLRVRNIKYTSAQVTSTKILPQFAFGGGWYSALYFANTADQAQSIQVQFVGDDAKPLFVPSVGSPSTTLNLPPRGAAILEALNNGPLAQGYVSVSLPDVVIGYGIFRHSPEGRGDQEAVVPLSGASGTKSTLIWDDTAFSTAVAIVNPSTVNNTVAITVRDLLGTVRDVQHLPGCRLKDGRPAQGSPQAECNGRQAGNCRIQRKLWKGCCPRPPFRRCGLYLHPHGRQVGPYREASAQRWRRC